MNRNSSVITICILLFSLSSSADAQQTVKFSRIGVLVSGRSSDVTPRIRPFQQRLRELGYVEGKNIIIEQRYAEGKVQIVPKGLGLQLHLISVKDADDPKNAFEEAKRLGVQALIAHPSTFMTTNHTWIIELAAIYRMPGIYPATVYTEAGGLMSYGVDLIENYPRAAITSTRSLRVLDPLTSQSSNPQIRACHQSRNCKTMDLGITPNVLARADKVIK